MSKVLFDNIVDHINLLEGFKTLLKGLHWGAPSLTMHRAIDDLLTDLTDFEDEIAETTQGVLFIQIEPSRLNPIRRHETTGLEAVKALRIVVDNLETLIRDKEGWVGVENVINDFQSKLLKHSYLILLASRCSHKM
jgi:DNA-binding ferritin-like protein